MPLLTLPRSFQIDSSGTPYAAAKLYTYRAGTTTNLATYTTNALSVALSNPIVADANGLFPAIYIDPDSGYDLRVILKTSAGVTIYDEDNIPRATTSFQAATFANSAMVSGIEPRIILNETDAGSDLKKYDFDVNGGVLKLRTRTDADGTGKDILAVTRTTTAVTSVTYGNATDNPTHSFAGTGGIASGGAVVAGTASNSTDHIAITKFKSSTTARTNIATLANDPDLVYAIPAAGNYRIEVHVNFHGTSSGAQGIGCNVNFAGTYTFGRTMYFGYVNGASVSTVQTPLASLTTAVTYSAATISTTAYADGIIMIVLLQAFSAGTIAFAWGQNSSSANATNVGGGSYMTVTKL